MHMILVFISHHVVHYEGQGGPVQASSKPRPEVLVLIGRAAESLRPDVQHLLSHLKPDVNSSIYAATHPKMVQNPSWKLGTVSGTPYKLTISVTVPFGWYAFYNVSFTSFGCSLPWILPHYNDFSSLALSWWKNWDKIASGIGWLEKGSP